MRREARFPIPGGPPRTVNQLSGSTNVNNTPADARPAQRRWVVVFCVLAGLYLLAIAADLMPVRAGSLKAPREVFGALSAIFLIAGLLAARLWPDQSRITSALGATLLTLFSAVGGWVAVLGLDDSFHGSVAAAGLSAPVSAPGIARVVFGAGALIVLAAALYAWWRVFVPRR